MSLEQLRNSQIVYLKDWRDSLLDLNPLVTSTGYLSYYIISMIGAKWQ